MRLCRALSALAVSGTLAAAVAGDNTVSFHQDGKICTVCGASAAPGYHLASGLGTVDAALLVPGLAGRPLAIARSAPLILPRRLP